MKDLERRTFGAIEMRVEHDIDDGGKTRISGHAAVFDSLSEDLGGFRERVAPGAFAASLAEDDIRALFNHDPNLVLGRNRAGTLRLAEDEPGLAIGIDPPDTAAARDIVTMIKRGDVTQMSFGFRTISDEFQMVDGEVVRTLKAVRLFDVSPVTFPAYPQTDVDARSFDAFKAVMDESERLLAEAEAAEVTPALTGMKQLQSSAEF